jgi:radical SAM protein with 4Fe4S-binding SPASM domain
MMKYKVKSVRWDITNKCNLKCLHCYTVDNPGADLSYSQVLHIIEKLRPLGLEEINFSGREPTLREDLPAIIKKCCAGDIRVNVTTNGTVLARKGFSSLLQSGLNMLVFSLDGVSDSTHDKVRGKGNFHKTIGNILMCMNYIRKNNISTKIGISCTLQKINAKELPKMISLCNILGIHFLSINPVSFCGSATEVKCALHLSADEILSCWCEICKEYKKIKPQFGLFLGTFPMETKLLNVKYDIELPVIHTLCSAGTTLYIDPHGQALPCYMLPSMANEITTLNKYLCYWDILNEPVEHAFNSFEPFISYAHTISKNDYSGCTDCPDVEICKGCPLIVLSEPDAIHRCQLAQQKLAAISPDFSHDAVPAIKKAIAWELDNDILHLSLQSGDYSSDKVYQFDHLTRSIWLKIDSKRSIMEIERVMMNEFAMLPAKEIQGSVNNFVEYFWKEGILYMPGPYE